MSHRPSSLLRRLTSLVVGIAVLIPLTASAALANNIIETQGKVRGGVYSDKPAGAAVNITTDVNALNAAAGRKVTFGGTFHDVCETSGSYTGTGWNCSSTKNHVAGQWSVTRAMLDEVWGAQATPFANLNIPATAASIASGAWDSRIIQWAGHVKGYLDLGGGRTVIIAPLQEANGNWTPYGCDPANFQVAYRKIVDIFRNTLGINETKVRWSFAPNSWSTPGCGSLASYYPGDDYVDVFGFSTYNFGVGAGCVGFGWHEPWYIFDDPINQLREVHPYKPILIAQTGAPNNSCGAPSGQDQSTWIKKMFDYAAASPNVAGLIYFNINTPSEGNYIMWAYGPPHSLRQGWAQGMTSSTTLYEWPLTSWFKPGALFTNTGPASPCPQGKDCDTFAFIASAAYWHLHTDMGWTDPIQKFYFGNPGDYPIMGDWDCNGTKTPGMFRQSNGLVYLRNSNSQGNHDIRFFFGNPGDIPIVGDFNGDGCDTVSIYRPSQGRFFIINTLGANDGGLGAADYDYYFGNPGDKPFVGDFDGDGVDTVGLHRESTGFVYYLNGHRQGNADGQFFFGNPGDKIFAGDWNGNGFDSIGIYRPANRTVYLRNSMSQGNADFAMWVGTFIGAATG